MGSLVADFDSFMSVFLSWLLLSLHKRGMSARLFLGQLAYYNDQQNHHRYADHRPNPHPSARPSSHPSVCMIHHPASFVTLRPFVTGQRGVQFSFRFDWGNP
jgi:hypothetical protein